MKREHLLRLLATLKPGTAIGAGKTPRDQCALRRGFV